MYMWIPCSSTESAVGGKPAVVAYYRKKVDEYFISSVEY